MDFPLSMHQHALDAAKAGRCAEAQGKFWEYHDELFANQTKLSPDDLKGYAKKLGLNTKQFDACFDDAKYESAVRADMHEGDRLGVTGTPTFFIDGRELSGAQPPSAFENIINDELAGAEHDKSASAK
jgi:protein-disulfide isomerase